MQEKDQYGNEVQRLARPLPVEYLLVDVPASTPLQPQYTFTEYDKRQPFPIENRYIDGQLQDFNALSSYLSGWAEEEFLEAISDFHLLVYLYKMDMLPLRQHMGPLLEAVRSKNPNKAADFKGEEVWKLLESLVQASSTGNGLVNKLNEYTFLELITYILFIVAPPVTPVVHLQVQALLEPTQWIWMPIPGLAIIAPLLIAVN